MRGPWRTGDTLLFRERFDAGWRYRLDGGAWRPARETALHFMAAPLDRDAARVELAYRPDGFFRWAGFSWGLTGLLGLLGLLLRRRLLRARS